MASINIQTLKGRQNGKVMDSSSSSKHTALKMEK